MKTKTANIIVTFANARHHQLMFDVPFRQEDLLNKSNFCRAVGRHMRRNELCKPRKVVKISAQFYRTSEAQFKKLPEWLVKCSAKLICETGQMTKMCREGLESEQLSAKMEAVSQAMAAYDLSDEQWDSLPKSVQKAMLQPQKTAYVVLNSDNCIDEDVYCVTVSEESARRIIAEAKANNETPKQVVAVRLFA